MATSITTTQSTRQYPLSRHDDRNIADPILRAELRKEVMLMCESNDKNLTIYYVLPDEQYRPDLLAYRMWGIAELRWVVTLAAGLEDESQGMTVGKKLKLPPATWIREMIRHFQYDGQVIGTLSIA
ncbi:hypothetical protein UX056_19935 [Escherichia coli]|nr:hypothetical protein [Escherichia coli]MDY8255826.1 hypothetical protein [Escherichia coli]MDY8501825.1 hypothetical protein [Escherichia coli]MDY8520195.1 hypothetical protein [Escherichia coli]MDY8547522.1 hypothetical protein [Escherichia coli]